MQIKVVCSRSLNPEFVGRVFIVSRFVSNGVRVIYQGREVHLYPSEFQVINEKTGA